MVAPGFRGFFLIFPIFIAKRKNMKKKKKVILAMSGGVDSSVSLALLVGAGFEVEGIHFRIKEEGFEEDEKMAREVAEKMGISFRVIDKRKDFKESVIRYFLEGYGAGITPNPCVFCNKNFKFKWLLGEMKKEKADAVATGHYARLRRKFPISNFQPACRRGRFPNKSKEQALRGGGHFVLFEAIDKTKDQSYFLYTLNQKELSRIIFPLGNLEKSEVRKIAKELELPASSREESQDICFLSGMKAEDFLRKNLKVKKGKIVDGAGRVRGEHEGAHFFTIGQRRGINIGGDGPYYVFAKDAKKNIIQISNDRSKKDLKKDAFEIENVNWISKVLKFPLKALVRVRYQEKADSAIIKKEKDCFRVELGKSKSAVAPGQSAVFYSQSGEVIGGGIIKL